MAKNNYFSKIILNLIEKSIKILDVSHKGKMKLFYSDRKIFLIRGFNKTRK